MAWWDIFGGNLSHIFQRRLDFQLRLTRHLTPNIPAILIGTADFYNAYGYPIFPQSRPALRHQPQVTGEVGVRDPQLCHRALGKKREIHCECFVMSLPSLTDRPVFQYILKSEKGHDI